MSVRQNTDGWKPEGWIDYEKHRDPEPTSGNYSSVYSLYILIELISLKKLKDKDLEYSNVKRLDINFKQLC